MIPLLSFIFVVALSLIINRVATVALMHTGMSQNAAAFQARSAFSGVGFTTREAESVVDHPVRRRIIMALMLMGNAGIVTAVATLLLSFLQAGDARGVLERLSLLAVGVGLLWLAAASKWLDRKLYVLISAALKRFSSLDLQDYSSLLHLGHDYRVREVMVGEDYCIVDKRLYELHFKHLGIQVLGVTRKNGEYVGAPAGATKVHAGDKLLCYGQASDFEAIDWRDESALCGAGAPFSPWPGQSH